MANSPERQGGVALLTVLLVVAMASILAVTMIKAQQSLLQRAASVFTQDQAYLYTLGAETLARTVLAGRPADNDKQKGGEAQDSLGEDWARRVPPFPVEGGAVQARLIDQQGKFNLNTLVAGQSAEHDRAAYLPALAGAGRPVTRTGFTGH
jgi:general secretion pathway protein K